MEHILEFTDANFKREVLESDQPVMVDFWAPWCGPCRVVGPTVEELGKQFAGKSKVGKVNVDENPRLSAQFGIHSIPTVLLFKHGQVVGKWIGVQPKQRYEQALQEIAA
ncbi:MAG: thioredoxin [Acidobacteriota bacterium]